MSLIYISENGTKLSVNENRLTVTYRDGLLKTIPIENIEGITLLSPAQVSAQCMEACIMHGIPIAYMSKGGRYFGRVSSTGHTKAALQRKQSKLYYNDFSLNLAKRIMNAKLRNQKTILRRYARTDGIDISSYSKSLEICANKVWECESISQVIGFEGQGAKAYFAGIAECIEPEFKFVGRSRRPPKDEFNSLISLGYSILMNELYSEIEMKGLNPYFGFVHRDDEKHPTLASDLMEEWRAIIVDSTAMSLINGHEISKQDFMINIDEPGCFLTSSGLKSFLKKLELKLETKVKYMEDLEYPVTFRKGISIQIGRLVEAIESENADIYKPIIIR
ncbi:MAG: CRISPR-associated endonuclease Cas1 [Lachnospiraceae bacterium]|nr:CRISPR-associated endonuclease Cas1 [Lachnospiraceae bacterium]